MKIEGFFSGIKNANETVEKLKKAGFQKSFSDLNDHYTMQSNQSANIPGTSSAPSLSGLILSSGELTDNPREGPLAAASPMVSGMGGFEEIADINYKVIVEVDEENQEKVKQIINEMGGNIANPNFKLPNEI